MEMTTDCFSALSHGSSTLQKNDVYKDNISMDYPCGSVWTPGQQNET